MNLERQQRDVKERALARATVAGLIEHLTATTSIDRPEVIAHHFGKACEELGFAPEDETAAIRVMNLVARDISERRAAAERIADAVRCPTYLH